MEVFKKKITKDQSRDTGMAMVLLLLIVGLSLSKRGYFYLAIVLQVVDMTAPMVFKPIAYLWLGLSELLGAVMSKVVMTIVYFGVVTPVAFVRRLAGKDSLQLNVFKAGQGSAMLERNHLFTAKDLERPY